MLDRIQIMHKSTQNQARNDYLGQEMGLTKICIFIVVFWFCFAKSILSSKILCWRSDSSLDTERCIEIPGNELQVLLRSTSNILECRNMHVFVFANLVRKG
jgi:hypothetical protein